MDQSTITPLFGDTRQVAARFGLSEATLATLRTRGGGPRFMKRGARVYYKFADVQAWLEESARFSTSEA